MSDVSEPALLEETENKGAEISSAPSCFRESRYYCFLRQLCLHLKPLPAPPACFIKASLLFSNDPFQPFFPGDPKKQNAFLRDVIAIPYSRVGGKNLFQKLLPPGKWQTRQIVPAEVQEI